MFKCEDLNLNEFLTLTERYGDFVSDTVFYTVRVFSLRLITLIPFVIYTPVGASRTLKYFCPNSITEVLTRLCLDVALVVCLRRMPDVYKIAIGLSKSAEQDSKFRYWTFPCVGE